MFIRLTFGIITLDILTAIFLNLYIFSVFLSNKDINILYPSHHNICFTDIDIHDIPRYTVGSHYLKNLHIASAEMTQYIYNIKMAATNCITKKY